MTERIDMAAEEPSRSRSQRFGVLSWLTSLQVRPPVPMRTVAPRSTSSPVWAVRSVEVDPAMVAGTAIAPNTTASRSRTIPMTMDRGRGRTGQG